ncbi:MAG: carboxypeptidase regulatory-like domain-containing protein [candidate division KSB1 bacterium]|nr:carboxypeptidase regulatory-like domain-containing protein [candidate division KSB1 bacterium]
MKFLKISVTAILMIAILVGSNLFAQNMGSGTIAGTVLGEVGNRPVAGATVLAINADLGSGTLMPKKFQTKTDAAGAYQLKSLPNGKYYVYAYADSFVSEFYDNTRNINAAKVLTISNGTNLNNINFVLKQGGIITGVVVDSTGKGIPNAIVAATPFDTPLFPPHPAWMDSIMMWGLDITDKAGNYQITTLDSGKYRVMAKLTAGMLPFFQIKFWENTDDPFDAKPVLVDNGQVTPNINFVFEIGLPTGGIAGTVKDAAGNPLKGIYVFAWKQSNGDSFYSNFRGLQNLELTDENGNYQIENLSPGKYIVSATKMDWWQRQTIYYDNVSEYDDATPVSVTDTITRNINFVFDKPKDLGSISGKVISDVDGAPIAGAYVEVWWSGTFVGVGKARFKPLLFDWTDDKGEYEIENMEEGKYLVLVHKNGYTEFYDNTQDIQKATVVEVKAGQETTGINFGIPPMPAGSKVAGVVTDDSTGAPIEGAMVTLFPVSNHPYGAAFQGKFTLFDFYATVTNAKGEYLIGGIPQGKYIAVCWAQNYIVEFYDNKTSPWSADRISLDGTEEKTGIDFSLTRGWGFKMNDPLAMGMISGQVTDTEGRYVSDAYVSVVDAQQRVRATQKTGPDGGYALVGIPAGDYFIKVDRMPYSSAYYGNVTTIDQATPVSIGQVEGFTITGVDVQLSPMSATAIGQQGETQGTPTQFELSQNYPNPFNPSTTISYTLPTASHVTLQIFNLQGELVKTLVNGQQNANRYQAIWHGENELGQKVAAGIYFYQLKTEQFSQTRRLILIK